MPPDAAFAAPSQNTRRRSRAPSAPPRRQPSASATAFIAPALAPEMAAISSRPSSNRASSTPQVKAPWAPPPCRARFTRLVRGLVMGAF
jgi:hypothetical protein